MQKSIWTFLLLSTLLVSCSDANETDGPPTSTNMFGEYFYTYDTIPKIYAYRDIANGLTEEFHRVFGIKDTEGMHIVVEIYSEDGRILEALNYNLDSLDIIDYMVVDRMQQKTKAELFKNKLIPDTKKSTASFAARFAGISDSTLFLKEINRTYASSKKMEVLGEKLPGVVFKDQMRLTLFNPFTKMEDMREGEAKSYFAKGYGLVEWHNQDKSVHYRLERIIPQEEFVNLMSQ